MPDRKSFSIDGKNTSFDDTGIHFGKTLASVLRKHFTEKHRHLREIQFIGGTLCSDGAKNMKRQGLQSVLATGNGRFWVQSTDVTGALKDTTLFLFNDILKAMR